MLSAYLQKILFGIALVATAPSIACAAEIEFVEEELCDIRITGEIVPGDAQRFVAALESARGARLCLNSRGGALQEAILIAEEVLRPFRVTTILEENSECLSACALIFMMGQTKEYDGITVFSRFMHHTATLGFHRPQVRFNFNGALDEESIISAFDTALDAVLEFLVLSTASNASSGDFIETDLLAQIIEHQGSDFFFIDRIDQVGRWDIGVFGYEPPERMDLLGAFHVCENFPSWSVGLEGSSSSISIWNYSEFFHFFEDQRTDLARDLSESRVARNHYDVLGSATGPGGHYCEVSWDGRQIWLCGENWTTSFALNPEGCGGGGGNLETVALNVEPIGDVSPVHIALFHGSTQLRDLPRAVAEMEERARHQDDERYWQAVHRESEATELLRRSCAAPLNGIARLEMNLSWGHDIPIYTEPGRHNQEIASIPSGNTVVVSGDASILETRSRSSECLSACRGANDNIEQPSIELNQCYESGMLWFLVEHAGRRGYVNGRWLRPALSEGVRTIGGESNRLTTAASLPGVRTLEQLSTCFPVQTVFRVALVQEFVNIRAQPGFDAEVVSTAPLGARLELLSTARLRGVGTSDQIRRCQAACDQQQSGDTSSAVLGAVRQCFEDNVLFVSGPCG